MPLPKTSYDEPNRMVETQHNSAGTHRYHYNHANQRVMRYSSAEQAAGGYGGYQRRFSLYGFAGELLLEANWEPGCVSGCPTAAEMETLRNVYFAGRKVFVSAWQGPLKAAVPNRLGSRSEHFPYGEQKGGAPPDGDKDYFTTYRRDETGLDYAWNRYYAPGVGRFTTADPYGGSAVTALPESWNRYAYTGSDPINRTDPSGLFWGFMPGSGYDWVACAMDPFGAMSTNWLTCGQSPWSEEMWSIIGPFQGPLTVIDLWYTRRQPGERESKIEEIVGGLVAVASQSTRTKSGYSFPRYLKVNSGIQNDYYDCSMGAVRRNVTYELYGHDDKRLYGFIIHEHLWDIEYDRLVTGDYAKDNSFSRNNFGMFQDQISVQLGPDRKYLQWFTVSSMVGTTIALVQSPLYVVGFGGTFSYLDVEKTRTYVSINGDRGGVVACQ